MVTLACVSGDPLVHVVHGDLIPGRAGRYGATVCDLVFVIGEAHSKEILTGFRAVGHEAPTCIACIGAR